MEMQNTATVIHVTPAGLGPEPARIQCPHCHQSVTTKIDPVAGLLTYLLVGACLMFGCVFGCCLIPCCVNSCQNINHNCPNCGSFLGTYKRL